MDAPSPPSAPEVVEEVTVEPRYSWEVALPRRQEEVTRESFAPTVLEFMTPASCDTDVMLCLKEVEPALHAAYQPLLPLAQVPALLGVTMNMRRMLPLKARLGQLQRTREEGS